MVVRRLLILPFFAALIAATFLSVLASTPAYANSTITVDPGEVAIAANGQCSLREAIINANDDAATHPDCAAGTGDDTIVLPAGIYILNDATTPDEDFSVTGDLDIRSNITLQGAGADVTFLDGNQTDRVLHVVTGVASVQDLTIQNGRTTAHDAAGHGAGINSSQALTLSGVIIFNNRTTGSSTSGGGAYVGSTASITGTSFISNTASNGGGASISGAASITGTSFLSNTASISGGGARISGAASITGTSFLNNTTSGGGGGAWIDGAASIASTTFLSNTANFGGGAWIDGAASIASTTFLSNTAEFSGGGVFVLSAASITGTSFISNTAEFSGGGAWIRGSTSQPSQVVNTLFANNRSNNNQGNALNMDGNGGINNRLTLLHNTISNPSAQTGPAIYVVDGTVGITNTIVANQAIAIRRLGGAVREDFNLFDSVTTPYQGTITSGGNSITGTAAFADAANDDYQLTALSDAINAGTDAGITSDFFGEVRPQGGGFDIGFDELSVASAANVCFATHNDGSTIFASADSKAVRDAVAAASAGGTVRIAGTCAGTVNDGGTVQVVRVTQPITLAGGYTTADWSTPSAVQTTTLDALQSGRVISSTAALTVQDLTLQNGRTTASSSAGHGAGINASQSLTLSGVFLYNNTTTGSNTRGGGAYVFGAASITGTTFFSNTASSQGGGAYVGGAASITDTSFFSNTASSSDGGGVFVNSTASITGTSFMSNRASSNGGGVYVLSTASITGTSFLSNTASNNGGGAFVSGAASIASTTFLSNTASNNGGGVYANTASITGSSFISNTASRQGGGAWIDGAASITGTEFISNTASGSGGGGYVVGAASIVDTIFRNNRGGWGGGVYVDATSTLTGTDFVGNRANGIGGGAYLAGASVITATNFYSNTADGNGGGAQIEGSGQLTQVRFEDNTSSGQGGGLYIAGTAWLSDTDFVRNTSTVGNGGGFYARNPVTLTASTFLSNRAAASGGGLLADAEVTLLDTSFISNTATSGSGSVDGGGVYARGAAIITQTTFLSNTAKSNGGGAYLADDATLSMTSFSGNSASNQGGGAFIDDIASLSAVTFTNNLARYGGGLILYGNANITGTTFLSNTATSWGGGLLLYRPTNITNTTFLSNTAGEEGGALWVNGSTLGPTAVVNSLFADNRVLSNRGDAVYMLGYDGADSRLALIHNTVANQSLEDGPAVYVVDGTVGITNTIVSNQAIAIERVGGAVTEDFNLFDNVTTPFSGTVAAGSNSITGTAAFVDAANGDFQLTALSDAINAGTDAGITTDFFGDVRPQQGGFDIGFDESPFAPFVNMFSLTAHVPVTNAVGVAVTTNITASFDADVDASTVTSRTFAAHTAFGGLITGTVSVSGDTVTLDPVRDFFAGERVQVIATAGISDTGGATLNPIQWGFRAGPVTDRCFANFVDSQIDLDTDVQLGSVAWADYDSDGDLDILITGMLNNGTTTATIYRNDSGAFVDSGVTLTNVSFSRAIWGDFDNDGDPDILLTGSTDNSQNNVVTQIYRNDGGAFTNINAGLPGISQGSVAWGDYDNDGDLDILLTGMLSDGSAATRLYRNGGGAFVDSGVTLADVSKSNAAWGDYDNDGDLDILLTGSTDGTYNSIVTRLYTNDGGAFTEITTGLPGVAEGSADWGDYDNDGDLDLLFTGGALDINDNAVYNSQVYRNDGGGTFTDISAGLAGVGQSSAAWGDYDNDGDLDILLTGYGSGNVLIAQVYRNDGGAFTNINAGLTGAFYSSVAWGDYDNDGDLDILISGQTGADNQTKLYRNDDCADLALEKSVSPASTTVDSPITYTLSFTNSGPSTAYSVEIRDSVPVQVSVDSAQSSVSSGVTITQTGSAPDFEWEVSDLPAGAGGVITLTGTISQWVTAAGIFTNTATIAASNDITTTNNSSDAGVDLLASPFVYIDTIGGDISVRRNGALLEIWVDGSLVTQRGIALITSVTISTTGTIDIAGHLAVGVNDVTLIGNVKDSYTGSPDISGNVTITGTVAPGASPGQLVINGDLTLGATDTLTVEIGGLTAGTQYDQIQITGANRTVTLGDAVLTTTLISSFVPSLGDSFFIIDNVESSSSVSGEFAGLSQDSLLTVDSTSFWIDYAGGTDDNDVVLTACANSVTVENVNASGAGSLRWAVAAVCPGGTINFNASLNGSTIDISAAGEIGIDKDLTIDGPGADLITVSGGNSVRVFNVLGGRVVTIEGIGVTDGAVNSGDGGGILNAGNLELQNVSIFENAAPNGSGGGIYNTGSLVISGTLIYENEAVEGGGVSATGNVDLVGSSVFNNRASRGAGLSLSAPNNNFFPVTHTLVRSEILNNTATGGGGGIEIDAGLGDSSTTITESTIANNSSGSDGGGIRVSMDNAFATLILINSTLSGNDADENGGGLAADGDVSLYNVTITGNTADADEDDTGDGGGLFGDATVQNSIIAGNFDLSPSSDIHPDVSGSYASSTYNVIGDNSGDNGDFVDGTDGNQVGSSGSPLDPVLGALQDNGGPIIASGGAIHTHALLAGSPALDGGDLTGCVDNSAALLTNDQRDFDRPDGVNNRCDVGALEMQPVDLAITKAVTPTVAAPGDTITYTLRFTNTSAVTASGVTISDSVPAQLSVISDQFSVGSGATITRTSDAPDLAWSVDNLPAGASGVITISGVLSDSLTLLGTTITNTAIITTDFEIDGSNNFAEAIHAVGLCFATPNSGGTVFASVDGAAVQSAIDAASAGGEVRIAGYCAGPQSYAGSDQIAYVGKDLTLRGGYTLTNWLTSDPTGSPTTLDAESNGRGIVITDTITALVENLNVTGGRSAFGGGIYVMTATVTISNSNLFNNVGLFTSIGDRNGGALMNRDGRVTVYSSTLTYNEANMGAAIGSFSVDGSATLTVTAGTQVRHNDAGSGAIVNHTGEMLIENSDVISNTGGQGGGVANIWQFTPFSPTLTITGSRIEANHAITVGGGIWNVGQLYITNSSVTSNTTDNIGGAVGNTLGIVHITDSVLSSNSAGLDGGAVLNLGPMTITRTQILSNTADGGGGIVTASPMTVTHSLIANNTGRFNGGGVSVVDSGAITLVNSTVSGNQAQNGNGGGIANENGSVALFNVTVAENDASANGGGIYAATGMTFALRNSLVATNTATSGPDAYGDFTSGGFNVVGDDSDSSGFGATDQLNVSALIGALADNGGSSRTHALLTGSPALNGGDPAGCVDGDGVSILADDQRGFTRPDVGSTRCDVGAVEMQSVDVGIVKSVSSALVDPGETITYTLMITSSSAIDPILGLVITDAVPVSISVTSVISSGLDFVQTGTSPYVWRVDSAIPGVTGTLTLTGVVTDAASIAGATITNTAIISAVNDSEAGNNAFSVDFTVSGADLVITKAVTPTVAAPGDAITYTLRFTNTSAVTAGGVVISDSVPAQLSVISDQSSVGGGATITRTSDAPDLAWRIDNLPAGASGVITVSGVLSDSLTLLGTTITNTAAITTDFEIDGSDNVAEAIHAVGRCFATPNSGGTVFASVDGAAVQSAIDAAGAGGEVRIAGYCAGVQTYAGSDQIAYMDKDLTLRGGYTLTDWLTSDPIGNPTTLDGEDNGRGIVITDTVTALVENLNVVYGYHDTEGAGIYIITSTVTISNSAIYNNWSDEVGGGLFSQGSDVTIHNSAIYSNVADFDSGGGLFNVDGSMSIHDSQIYSNVADYEGGGLLNLDGTVTIHNSLFEYNDADGGSAMGNISFNTLAVMTVTAGTEVRFNVAAGGTILNTDANMLVESSTVISNYVEG